MSCCGDKRRALRPSPTESVPVTTYRSPVIRRPTGLAYLGSEAIVVRGPVTGLTYVFGGGAAALEVDERDVPALVATRSFARTQNL